MKKVLGLRFAIAMLVMGILFAVAGWFMMNIDDSSFIAAEATITNIKEEYDYFSETYEHEVTLKYDDIDGNTHVTITTGYSSRWHEGDVIEIKYNPNDFDDISIPGLSFIPYIFFGAGVLVVLYGISEIVKASKRKIDDNDLDKVDMNNVTEVELENIRNSTSITTEYYFHPAYKMNQGNVLETTNHEPIFEAIPTHIGIFTKNRFNFVNGLTHYEEEKTVSHTINQSYGVGDHRMSSHVVTDSYFKINGVNCWKALGELGYSLVPDIDIANRKLTYDVQKYGISVATLECAGTNIMTGKDYKLGNLPAHGIFKVFCKDEDIEGVFLACFILSRTEIH